MKHEDESKMMDDDDTSPFRTSEQKTFGEEALEPLRILLFNN
jgi:hypothetical protein